MDKYYLIAVIDRLQAEMLVHDTKFAGNPMHKDCQTRFKKTLLSLQEELAKISENI
jgi:hypothetical protein